MVAVHFNALDALSVVKAACDLFGSLGDNLQRGTAVKGILLPTLEAINLRCLKGHGFQRSAAGEGGACYAQILRFHRNTLQAGAIIERGIDYRQSRAKRKGLNLSASVEIPGIDKSLAYDQVDRATAGKNRCASAV